MTLMITCLVACPMIGAFICRLVGMKSEKGRDTLAILTMLVTLGLSVSLLANAFASEGAVLAEAHLPEICGFGLHLTMDGFRAVYAFIAAWMWIMATAFSPEYFAHHHNRNRYYFYLLLTCGATMGVFLSADLYTTFIFFEIMSFTSYVWVAQEENAPSLRAAETYLAVAVIGGLVMLMGIFILYRELGTVRIDELLNAASAYENKRLLYVVGTLLVFGFGAKAGAVPLHIWLPKAHPVAPAPASALLSGILTKSGIYGILAVSCNIFLHDTPWGLFILIIGTMTMFGGAFLAVFSVDLKRTLACSSMSQIGFILIGVAMQCLLGHHNQLAVFGTVLHMVNHSLIKLVLFLCAGVVFMNLHKLNLNDIRGFGRKKPLLMICFAIGALCIGGIVGFGGYISKTLLHEAIVEGIELCTGIEGLLHIVEAIFLFSGGLTIAYMTKLFVCLFIEENADSAVQARFDAKTSYMNPLSSLVLALSAGLLFLWGILSHATMDRAADLARGFMHGEELEHMVHYYSLTNLKGAIISLAIGLIVYFGFIRTVLMKKAPAGEGGKEEGAKANEAKANEAKADAVMANEAKVYVNLWPEWFDIENKIYRPLLLTVLPGISAFFCKILDGLVDNVVAGLRKTVYADSPLPGEKEEKSLVGTVYHAIYDKSEAMRSSFSFALLLFCIGFSLMFIYLLWI